MKSQDLTRLEAAMRDANPLPQPTDLIDSDESAAVTVLVREGTDTTSPGPVLDYSPGELNEPAPRRRAFAFVAGLAAALLVVGAVAVLRPGTPTGPDVADQTTTTSITTTMAAVTTTMPEATPPGPVALDTFVFPAADVPPFTATVVYDMNPGGADDDWIPAEATMTVQVLFNGPEDYLYQVLSAEPANEAMEVFGPAGLTILVAGDRSWIIEPGDAAAFPQEDFGPVRHLLWNTGFPAWDEVCSTGVFEALTAETVAGRATTHGRCSTATDQYELWVDTETGVVMKLNGALGFADLVPTTTGDGGFEIIEFALGYVELPPPPPPPPPPGELPPLHLIQVEEYTENAGSPWTMWTITREIWYQDDGTWIDTTTDSTNPEVTSGSFSLLKDGLLRGCDAADLTCWELDDPKDFYSPVTPVPSGTMAEHCDFVGEEEMLGRTADHYLCGVALFEPEWVPRGTMDPPVHHWIDQETSIQVRQDESHRKISLSLIEINPFFPAGVFEYVEPEPPGGCTVDVPGCRFWWTDSLVQGEPAPTFSGPLLNGTTFRLEDLQGQPAVVFRWESELSRLDQSMDVFQALAEKWEGQVGFLGVPEETLDEAQRIVERGGYTFDNVACYEAEGTDHVLRCEPTDVMSLWEIGWPAWIILDEAGNALYSFAGNEGTFATLDGVIEDVLES